jgi:hypothetical protein
MTVYDSKASTIISLAFVVGGVIACIVLAVEAHQDYERMSSGNHTTQAPTEGPSHKPMTTAPIKSLLSLGSMGETGLGESPCQFADELTSLAQSRTCAKGLMCTRCVSESCLGKVLCQEMCPPHHFECYPLGHRVKSMTTSNAA